MHRTLLKLLQLMQILIHTILVPRGLISCSTYLDISIASNPSMKRHNRFFAFAQILWQSWDQTCWWEIARSWTCCTCWIGELFCNNWRTQVCATVLLLATRCFGIIDMLNHLSSLHVLLRLRPQSNNWSMLRSDSAGIPCPCSQVAKQTRVHK